jgi:hypothetical protein
MSSRLAASQTACLSSHAHNILLYCINNALFSSKAARPAATFDKHAHTCDICVSASRRHRHQELDIHILYIYTARLMCRPKKTLREFQYRVQSYRKILTPGNHHRGNTDGFDTGGYTLYTYARGAAHILVYIYICDYMGEESSATEKEKKTVSMSFQTSNRQHTI